MRAGLLVSAFLMAGAAFSVSGPRGLAATPAEAREPFSLAIERHKLENGLRVVLCPDHDAPSVAIAVTYDVGARNEGPRQRGFAHLFEHMMFQGSRNIPKGDHFRLIAARGGQTNGTTSTERTNYHETLPSGELDLGLWLEADRMKTLAITRRKFENQRAVVQEEYRMRVTNRAYAFGLLRLYELVFQGVPPYEHTALGSMRDLDDARVEWVKAFHDSYYGPNNAVLSIAGDFEPAKAMELVHEYFDDAQPVVSPTAPETKLPRQTSERLSVLEDSNAKTPGVYFGWAVPDLLTKEHRALRLAAVVLADGESSALHHKLVLDDNVARSVSAWVTEHRGPSLFAVRFSIAQKASIDSAQKIVDAELKRLRVAGPTDAELSRARAQIASDFVFDLQSNARRATKLGWFETALGNAELINEEVASFEAITRQDIALAVAKYLDSERRTIVEVYPPGWVKDEYPAVLQRTHIVRKGDSLIGIANQYGVTVSALTKHNNVRESSTIYPGQKLIVPKTSRGGRPLSHEIKKGDTLIGIAHQHGVSVSDLIAANRIKRTSTLIPGEFLRLPSRRSAGSRSASTTRSHKVAKGDTLIGIAKRYGVSVADIIAINKISKKRIYAGQTLTIPPPKRSK